MAEVHFGRNTFFRVSPAVDSKALCFAVRRGEVVGRFDAKYLAFREGPSAPRFPLRALGSLVRKEPDYGSGARAVRRTSSEQPRYIRITDFGEDGIEPGHEFLTADPVEKGYDLFTDDLLFARSGATVGKTYIHEDTTEPAIFAGYCIRFKLQGSEALPRFVYWFTKTTAYARWVARIQRPAGQPNINKEEYKSLELPLPPPAVQGELVAALDAARVSRRMKLAHAVSLLAGTDGFALDAMGLAPPPRDDRKVFAVRRKYAQRQGHLNADYFHPERVLTLRTIEDAKDHLDNDRLGNLVDLVRDQVKTPDSNYISLAHVQSNTGELVDADEVAEGACSRFRPGDVLFARLRPYLNKVHLAETEGCCSPEFYVLRTRDPEALRPAYLAVVLRSSIILAQTRHMMTGNTHPRLTGDDVVELVVPKPRPEMQERIATEAGRRREGSRRLRAEAEVAWLSAKRIFEERLFGAPLP